MYIIDIIHNVHPFFLLSIIICSLIYFHEVIEKAPNSHELKTNLYDFVLVAHWISLGYFTFVIISSLMRYSKKFSKNQ